LDSRIYRSQLSQSIYSPLTKIPTVNSKIFMAIGAIIAALSLVTFIATSTSASLSNFTINKPSGNTTDDQNDTNIPETESSQSLTPSESLTVEGLSPQDESDLAIACSVNPERC
jgi:hypothetical protein